MHQNVLVLQAQPNTPQQKTRERTLSRKERLSKVQGGVAAGKSNRQIAKELGVDEGTVRRDRRTLLLSKEDLQAVKSGAAVEPLLRKQERRKAATAREKHEAAERESRFLTNRLAKWIANWLNGFNLIPPNMLHVIMGLERLSWEYGTRTTSYVPDSKIRATIEATRPKADNLEEVFALIEFLKTWLFRWMLIVEPVWEIRDRALIRLRQDLEKCSPLC